MFDNIKKELSIIWAIQKFYKLNGKMRLYAPLSVKAWQSYEKGYQVWFNASEIETAIKKLRTFFRDGKRPNTPLFLDPIVYTKNELGEPIPLGSAVIWSTVIAKKGESFSQAAIERLQEIGIFVSKGYCQSEPPNLFDKQQDIAGDNSREVLKIFGISKKIALPSADKYDSDGISTQGMKEIHDILNEGIEGEYRTQYLLSDMVYNFAETSGGDEGSSEAKQNLDGAYYLHHQSFASIFNNKAISSVSDITKNSFYFEKLKNAAKCWNAYNRDPVFYRRYGIDISNLERNIGNINSSENHMENIKQEILFLLKSQREAGFEGYMRLFSVKNQEKWRAKEQAIEIFINEENLSQSVEEIKKCYNDGILPNTPLFLDPIIYKLSAEHAEELGHKDGGEDILAPVSVPVPIPLGSCFVFATCLTTGDMLFNEQEVKERFDSINMLYANIHKSNKEVAGLRGLVFLRKPYVFSEQEQQEFSQRREKEQSDALPRIKIAEDIFSFSGCNNAKYCHYYMLPNMEYINSYGGFTSENFKQLTAETAKNKHTISVQKIMDAARCFSSYDYHHSLWVRFGNDINNLKQNITYFNMCARDFTLFNNTGSKRDGSKKIFQFFVPGWIPKAAVTLIAASGGVGKSSLAHRLATISAIDYPAGNAPKFLGKSLNLEVARGLTIYFSGEDSAEIFNARAEIFDPASKANRLMMQRTSFLTDDGVKMKSIGDFLENLHKLPDVSLVVIDPARKYLEGDENDSEVVSKFFEAIEEFAIEKQCAMVVVHHLEKKAKPENVYDIVDLLRGSQVFIDRPRVVIGMMRQGEDVIVGLAKNNIPPNLGMVMEPKLFTRDAKNLDLIAKT